MTDHARSSSRWRVIPSDGFVSFLLRSALWLILILMMLIPLTGSNPW